MRFVDVVGTGMLGLRTRRLRAALSALGIAIGIAAMVAVLGVSSSSRADLLAELDELGTNLLKVSAGQSFLGEDDVRLPGAAPAMVGRAEGVERVVPVTHVDATVRRTDHIDEEETGGLSVVATEPSLLATLAGSLRSGRFLDAATSRYPAVVLGADAARTLGIDRPGPRVWIGGRWFSVIGILEPLGLAPDLDAAAMVGERIARTRLGAGTSPSSIYVRVDEDHVEAVRSLLPATANPHRPEEASVSRPSDALEAKAAVDTALRSLLLGLGAVALLVGGVGIANVMVVSVLERRGEVGLRRALGATRRRDRLPVPVRVARARRVRRRRRFGARSGGHRRLRDHPRLELRRAALGTRRGSRRGGRDRHHRRPLPGPESGPTGADRRAADGLTAGVRSCNHTCPVSFRA